MRYDLIHTTRHDYNDEVTTSYGRAHLLPRDQAGQKVINAHLQVSPAPNETGEHLDYFGNRSSYFAIREAHTSLDVTSRCSVEIERPTFTPEALNTTRWEQGRVEAARKHTNVQFTLPSPQVGVTSAVREYAAQIFQPGRPLGETLVALVHHINSDFEYRSGSTTVRSRLGEVLAKRSGVCQDFAHLAVGCLRSVGLAARYVSGYLETRPPEGSVKLQGADASHAWTSVLVPGGGWVDLDPTNNQFIDDRYVVLAVGRDYSDVPPLTGVITTDATRSTMHVSVDVIPIL